MIRCRIRGCASACRDRVHRASFGLNLNFQWQLFAQILDELVKNGGLTKQLLDVGVKKDGKVELLRISLHAEEVT